MTVRPSQVTPPVRKAPANIQARRVFALARLLTTITGLICALAHIAFVAYVIISPADDQAPLDAWLYDIRVWAAIFAFWAVVMWLARRPLRLDSVERDR